MKFRYTLFLFGVFFLLSFEGKAQLDTLTVAVEEDSLVGIQEEVKAEQTPQAKKASRKEEIRKRRVWLDSTKAVRDEKYQALLETMVYQTRDLEQLTNRTEFTLFAPNNEAFKRVPIRVFDYLMKPENLKQLEEMITYHVVDKQLSGKDIRKLVKKGGGSYTFKTVGGVKLHASLGEGDLILLFDENQQKVIKITAEDWKSDKGHIHVIDQVLIPFRFLY